MGDRKWWYAICPKCKQETLECYEHDSAELKVDTCENPDCNFTQRYVYEEEGGVISVREVEEEDL